MSVFTTSGCAKHVCLYDQWLLWAIDVKVVSIERLVSNREPLFVGVDVKVVSVEKLVSNRVPFFVGVAFLCLKERVQKQNSKAYYVLLESKSFLFLGSISG